MFIALLFLLLLLFRSNTRRVGRDGKNWNREAGTLFTFWAPLEKLNLLRRKGERIVNYYGNPLYMFSQQLYFCALYVNAVVEFLEWDCSLFKGEFTILLKFSLFFFFFLFVQLEKERKAREEREKRDAEEAAERQRREEEWVRVITVVDFFFCI